MNRLTKLSQCEYRRSAFLLQTLKCFSSALRTQINNNFADIYCNFQKTEDPPWDSIVIGHARRGHFTEAMNYFSQMLKSGSKPSQYTLLSILNVAMKTRSIEDAIQVHSYVISHGFSANAILCSAMIDVYGKCSAIEDARQVFDEMRVKGIDISSAWDTISSRYYHTGYYQDILNLVESNDRDCRDFGKFLYANVFSSCARLGQLEFGKQVHSVAMKLGLDSETIVGSSIVNMYSKSDNIYSARKVFDGIFKKDVVCWTAMVDGYMRCKLLDEARQLFDGMPNRNTASWNAMIGGYVQGSRFDEALMLFRSMLQFSRNLDSVTFGSVLTACAGLTNLEMGKQLHAYALRVGFGSDVFVGNAVLNMYCKCGSLENAANWFNMMEHVDVVSWNALISSCIQHGQDLRAVDIFEHMKMAGVRPTEFTFSSILSACANLKVLDAGKQVHASAIKAGVDSNAFIGSALVYMYSRSVDLDNARLVFDVNLKEDIVLWHSMMFGYVENGCGREVLELFEAMLHNGISPEHVTFVAMLNACSNEGLVDEGLRYFESMRKDFYLTPSVDHYACMINLLGRAGLSNEVADFINSMPFEPNAVMLKSLLENCKVHGFVELGEWAANQLQMLEPESDSARPLLAGVYAAAGRFRDAAELWRSIDCKE